MAEAKSPRKKTVAAKPSPASPTKKPAAKAAKAAPARAAAAKAAPAKAAPARSATAKPAGRAAKPTREPTHEEIVARKERKKNAALRVAKKALPPRTGAKKAAVVEAKPAAKKPTTGAKKPTTGAKKPAAPKTPRKRPELSASTPDAAAQRRDGARELAKLVAAAGIDKKAERIEIIDIGEKVDYADFLVLMSGRSDRQVRAVADGVTEALREKGHRPGSVEGMQQGQWVLVDYTDVIVHVFVDEARRYYDLEGLWMDATRVPFEGTPTEGVKLVVAAVGRVKEAELRVLLDDYYGRVRRYAELTEVELKDEREDRVVAQFERCLAAQGERAELVTLEVEGKSMTSEAFAAKVDDAMRRAVTPVFAIGGAEGLPSAVRAKARWRLSLGAMTLPHRLARLILAEQVYRAFSIIRGEPYNK